MNQIPEIIIIGGGKSIQIGLSLNLKNRIKDKFILGTNYSYKHFDLTALCFIDKNFYIPEYARDSQHKEKNPDIWKELEVLPLILGLKKNPDLTEFLHPNTIMIDNPKPSVGTFLTGIFALTLAEKLEPKNIFLLGFDWNKRDPKTIPTGKDYNPKSDLNIHYYDKKEIQHRGLGYVGFYETHNPNNYFKYFENSKSKIYNVSPESNITTFEKIDYPTTFNLLSDVMYNQEDLRQEVRRKLCTK
jgi:hypothetical protein